MKKGNLFFFYSLIMNSQVIKLTINTRSPVQSIVESEKSAPGKSMMRTTLTATKHAKIRDNTLEFISHEKEEKNKAFDLLKGLRGPKNWDR